MSGNLLAWFSWWFMSYARPIDKLFLAVSDSNMVARRPHVHAVLVCNSWPTGHIGTRKCPSCKPVISTPTNSWSPRCSPLVGELGLAGIGASLVRSLDNLIEYSRV